MTTGDARTIERLAAALVDLSDDRTGNTMAGAVVARLDAWHPEADDAPFASACRRDGFASVHAVPMRVRGRSIGSLTLFRRVAGVLDPPAGTVAQALADTAATSVWRRWLLEQARA